MLCILRVALLSLLPLVDICWHCGYATIAEAAISFGEQPFMLKAQSAKVVAAETSHVDNFFPALDEFSSHFVIRPQIHHGRHRRAIQSTLDTTDGLHIPLLTLSYNHDGLHVQIDLQRNDRLLPDEHFLRYQNSKTTHGHVVQNFTKTEIDLCHYQGTIRGKPDSTVAVSTCNGGINGVVYDGIDTYFIYSDEHGHIQDKHYLLRHADMLENNATCGYNSATDDYSHYQAVEEMEDLRRHPTAQQIKIPQRLDGSEFNRILRYKRSNDGGNVIRGPYNGNKHSSYVELVIVVDNKVYKHFGENTKKVHQHCKDLANIVNALYVPLNIFVALVGVVIWNESNEIEFSSDGDVTLRNFLNYRSTKLVLDHPNDNAQLLTKEQFSGGVVGKALKGPICTFEYSGGVSMQHSQILAVVATTMAHEMGHNFGMEHDSPDCKCQDEKCIMAASSTAVVPVHWSSCSIDQLNIAFSRGMNYCLRNKPTKLFDSPQCGNGFVEPGEQCDCGLPNYCENTCCDPYTCMLHANASCATGECCDLTTCRPKVAGTFCRDAENECDLPEYCTGESEYCPGDVYKRDTEECDKGQAFCFQGNCRSHANQCRILWGPTGANSEHCYYKNAEGVRLGNCGYYRWNKTFIRCEPEHVACGMLHCRHLNERLEFGMESAAVLSHSYINHGGQIVPCRTALVDLGLQSTDPGLTPNGAKCGDDKMCVDQKCLTLGRVRQLGFGAECPENCNGNGVCNSRGNCHCNIGFTGATCLQPGQGGSVDSGPATNPNSNEAFQRFMYIFFFAVIPFIAAFCWFMYYCRNHPLFLGGKLAENIIKSASGTKQPPLRPHHAGGQGGNAQNTNNLPKSTPSSTDDMNSALLKSPNDSSDGMFGVFKGYTLRPLKDTTSPTQNLNGPNVAYVQPTVQDTGVPQRAAPPPPIGFNVSADATAKMNGTLIRKAPAPPAAATAPALPPPNPGSNARPIISLPVLETSTSTLTLPFKPMSPGEISPTRTAPIVPVSTAGASSTTSTLKPAPAPPVPLHTDPKLNIRRDGTIRRIASFLKKEDKPPVKEKTYIEREKLRKLEISAPIPVNQTTGQAESSNSDSETTPREEETKNLVKRAQSMRSPTKKTNVQSFGSMRHAPGVARPKSSAGNSTATRPKSPPPRPPPVIKKTNSTTSSGYQLPVATAKRAMENTYDDCESVELPLTNVGETIRGGGGIDNSNDDIYSVIDEIPPAAQTIKRSDLVSIASTNSDMGLLGEIVNEIEKRNGDSIYTATTLSKGKLPTNEETAKTPHKSIVKNKISQDVMAEPTKPVVNGSTTTAAIAGAATNLTPTYLRPSPLNAPVARVAPTRSDLSPTTAFSSFKPPQPTVAGTTTATASATASATTTTKATKASSVARPKSFSRTSKPTLSTGGAGASNHGAPSATIQKPKPLSAKPSFSNNQKKTPGASASATSGAQTGARVTPPTVKSVNIASLTQRFEQGAAARK